jgi:hypothetical protein
METFKYIIAEQEFEFQYENEVWNICTFYKDNYYENANVDFAGLKNQDIKYIRALLRYPATFDLFGDNLLITWEVDILGNIVIHLNKIVVPKQIDAKLKEKDVEIRELRAELEEKNAEICELNAKLKKYIRSSKGGDSGKGTCGTFLI